jgi:superfamily II DNA or RNA helicase/HKD family nuclease
MKDIQLLTSRLGTALKDKISRGKTVYLLTAFVMRSGVKVLKEALKTAAENGADIKILTGDYLFVTQPEGLRELLEIDERIEIRLWKSNGNAFHPKAYLIETENHDHFFVGSSNLSASAMNHGVEWNVLINDKKVVFEEGTEEFIRLFLHDQTISLNKETLKHYEKDYTEFHRSHPNLARQWPKQEEIDMMLPTEPEEEPASQIAEPNTPYGNVQPRFAQIDALEELEKTVDDGYKKAMVVMATGLGKTYLAAFFAKRFQRVLFVAHREEILKQAANSFKMVIPESSSGIYNAKQKEGNADFVFASVFTLSMDKHLHQFSKDQFDLIIIDEFHHAAADTYQRVLDYFEPQFLLGITATPDRNDNRDVYAICDGNLAYRIDFLQAIQQKWLSPFSYYGVYDDTDYSQIRWLGTRYDEEELLQIQLRESMAEKIIEAWKQHKQTKTLVFCSSIRQAEFLSTYFNDQGYNTVDLTSKQKNISRQQAILMLENGSLDAIFTVDLFNEGVDIPAVDTLLFVRPTESLTVFTQQIGRGLRLHENKQQCVIIDLIGNYRNADVKLSLFDQSSNSKKSKKKKEIIPTIPESCKLQLETNVINLLDEMARKQQPRKQQLLSAYWQVKEELGRRPTYKELHLRGRMSAKPYYDEWKSYHAFLYWAEELTSDEEEVFLKYENWLKEVEKTGMQKSYKMVVLKAMLDKGSRRWYEPITPEEVAPFFHHYVTSEEYRKRIDFSDKSSQKLWEYDERKVAKLVATMPMSKWSGSSKGLIGFEDNLFTVHLEVEREEEELLYEFTREICEYRLQYFFQRREKLERLT